LKGVARVLKQESPGTRIVAAEPDNAPVLSSGIPQPRSADGTPTASHPQFRPHVIQGWSPDFIAKLTEDAVRSGHVDEIVPVSGAQAMQLARDLAQREGIFVGTSSGATLAAALAIAQRAPKGANIVCMLPDTGERYLSTPLFEDIQEQMNAEELALSRSTPRCRFDAAPAPAAAANPAPASAFNPVPAIHLDIDATNFVDDVIGHDPVVLFALEWCEFSWAVRKFFAKLGIAYRSIDLDSVAYQANDRGGKIRAVLAKRVGAPTIPQIFVAGRHFGGCTELFDAWRCSSLQQHMFEHSIEFDRDMALDPASLLPKWVHPRGGH
jgi:cysteine synthase A